MKNPTPHEGMITLKNLSGSSNEEDVVDLEYTDLPIEIVVRRGNPTGYYSPSFGNWLPDEDTTKEITTDYTLQVDKDEIITYIVENCISSEVYDSFNDDDAVVKYIEDNFDEIFTKYEENIKSAYWDDARECAERDYESEEPDYDPYDESFINEKWVKMTNIDKQLIDELNDFLKSRDCDHIANVCRIDGIDHICFDITWGDWKHDHMRVWHLVNEFCKDRGYHVQRDMVTTETDGSDTFSAEHYFEVEYDDELTPMYESYLDDVREQEAKSLKDTAAEAANTMGSLASKLGSHNKDQWEAQISEEDITNMKNASNAAWLLYHYKNDGKVRPLHK